MKLKNIKIGSLLIIGLTAILVFMGMLAVVSMMLTGKMHSQAEMLFDNPLEARRAIGEIRSDAYLIHWALETAFRFDNYIEQSPYLQTIDQAEKRLRANLDLLEKVYHGDLEPLERLRHITLYCKHNRDEVLNLLSQNNPDAAYKINIHSGTVIGSAHFDEIVSEIDQLSSEAKTHAQHLLNHSHTLNNRMQFMVSVVSILMVFISMFVAFLVMRHVRNPVLDISVVARTFAKGDLSVRVNYQSNNELGEMAESFNAMAANISEQQKLNDDAGNVSGSMLNVTEKIPFFKTVLQQIMEYTASDLGAVYLLDDDGQIFEHLVSIGCDQLARQSFSAIYPEGELGMAVATRKVQHLVGLFEDSHFVFHTVYREYKPSERLVVPLITANSVVGVISLASLHGFSQHAVALINKIHLTLSARVEGLLAFEKIRNHNEMITQQNSELNAQKRELDMQASELSEVNRELSVQQQELIEANKLKTTFLSNMSHELRTPLNSVIALAGVLEKKLANKLPEEEADYMTVIRRNALQLLAIIDDILDIARIDAGKEELRISNFKPEVLVNEIIDLVRPQLVEKPVALNNLPVDMGVVMCSDYDKMGHILRNLISNAVKFTEEGEVQVSIRKDDKLNTVSIEVKDTGIGINANELPHIFDEFRQVDSSTSRRFEGTGLGLAIARKYAELLGGHIAVESKEGEGTEFTLVLPLVIDGETIQTEVVSQAESAEYSSPLSSSASPLEQKTILLVEDSEPATIQVKYVLEESGLRVLVARNGSEALEMLQQEIPDAMVVDLMMPEVDGFELLELLRNRKDTAQVPVLILTAKHISKEELKFLKQNNIFQLIRKGDIGIQELLKAVGAMVTKDA
jgi:signal transduction histidine kinase/CheY-like chemotaxis protein/HAMP domain-containing protein